MPPRKKRNRDNFPEGTKRVLWERVGGLCSNPDCRKRTLGPDSSAPHKSLRLGEAAHIHAAAPLGPRYNDEMTSAQRKSAENGIWLCTACAKKIDRNKSKYPADILKAWKDKAEVMALQDLEKPIPGHNEALAAFGILTGRSPFDNVGIIPGVHAAVRSRFESIDPRLDIGVNYIEGLTELKISAKKHPVDMSLNFFASNKAQKKSIVDKMQEMLYYGGKYEFSETNMSIEGSPLFDSMSNSVNKVKIESGEDVLCFIEVLSCNSEKTLFSVQTKGKFSTGLKGFKLATSAWDDIITFEWKNPVEYEGSNLACKINFNLKKWEGSTVLDIDYFDELYGFCKLFSVNRDVKFTIISSKINMPVLLRANMSINYHDDLMNLLNYTNATRIISEFLNKRICFTLDCCVSAEEMDDIFIVADIIKYGKVNDLKINDGPFLSGTFKLDAENIAKILPLKNEKESITIAVCESDPKVIPLMGVNIETPPQKRVFHNVVPTFREEERPFKIGDSVTIDFFPAEEFSMVVSFDDVENRPELSAKAALY